MPRALRKRRAKCARFEKPAARCDLPHRQGVEASIAQQPRRRLEAPTHQSAPKVVVDCAHK